MSDSTLLLAELLEIGRRAGLDHVAVCDAAPFTETRAIIEERRASGYAAGMAFTYRNPARSTDPARTVPGARSLIVGARSYHRRRPEPPSGPVARVAEYSWTDHYADLRRGLEAIALELQRGGYRARVAADDNALVDRAAAVRAGLGWYGKNANVLLPGAGSRFVLGSVITDAPLADEGPPPDPVGDGCGRCRRCLADCPTGALIAPGVLDARLCLAWLLQAPGVFPAEHRVALGDRIYGCDECQARCPVNLRHDRSAASAPGTEEPAQAALPVLALLAAADEELEVLVGRWYIPGREMRYVRRNALVVLGNVGDGADPGVAAALRAALGHADPLIRAHAVWAARRLGRTDLLTDLAGDDDPMVAAELAPEVAVAAAGAPSSPA